MYDRVNGGASLRRQIVRTAERWRGCFRTYSGIVLLVSDVLILSYCVLFEGSLHLLLHEHPIVVDVVHDVG